MSWNINGNNNGGVWTCKSSLLVKDEDSHVLKAIKHAHVGVPTLARTDMLFYALKFESSFPHLRWLVSKENNKTGLQIQI